MRQLQTARAVVSPTLHRNLCRDRDAISTQRIAVPPRSLERAPALSTEDTTATTFRHLLKASSQPQCFGRRGNLGNTEQNEGMGTAAYVTMDIVKWLL